MSRSNLERPEASSRSCRWPGVISVAVFVLLAACAKDAPQDYLDPAGPIAKEADHFFKSILFLAVLPVLILVQGLLVFAIVRYRRRPGRPDPPDRKFKLRWVVAPTMVLLVVDLFPLVEEAKSTFELAREPEGDVVQVDVYGHMWWWEYHYPDLGVWTANELHIPTGRPVRVSLHSIEPGMPAPQDQEFATGVLHSFWVPKLAGKQDVIPGRVNKLTLIATEPDTYLGQCAEYCNLSHANMRLRVIAQEPADFDRWVTEQQEPAAKPAADSVAAAGYKIFTGRGGCVACHSVAGIEGATARVGPNLTHLHSRDTFAGATLDLTTENLKRWVDNPSALKPMRPERGTGMPDQGLSPDEIDKVVAFLETLK